MANERYVVAIGADNAGADMKNALKKQLEADPRVDVVDLGVPDASDDQPIRMSGSMSRRR